MDDSLLKAKAQQTPTNIYTEIFKKLKHFHYTFCKSWNLFWETRGFVLKKTTLDCDLPLQPQVGPSTLEFSVLSCIKDSW